MTAAARVPRAKELASVPRAIRTSPPMRPTLCAASPKRGLVNEGMASPVRSANRMSTNPNWICRRFMAPPRSHGKRAAEASRRIVRLSAVVIHEHLSIASVAEEGSTERANIRRGLDPTGRLRIELAQLLQLSVLFLGQQIDPHFGSHFDSTALRLVLLP